MSRWIACPTDTADIAAHAWEATIGHGLTPAEEAAARDLWVDTVRCHVIAGIPAVVDWLPWRGVALIDAPVTDPEPVAHLLDAAHAWAGHTLTDPETTRLVLAVVGEQRAAYAGVI